MPFGLDWRPALANTVNTYSTVERSGVYVCGTCGDNQVTLHKDDEAPRCCDCKWPVTWLYHHPIGRRPIGFVIPS